MGAEFLSKTFYGNTVGEWGTALLIIIAVLLLSKALYWVLSNIVKKLTSKTKTQFDDILIDLIEEPIIFAVTVGGIWFGLNRLNFGETLTSWINGGVRFLVIIAVTWLIARLVEAVFTHYLAPIAARSENDLDDQLLPIARKGGKTAVWIIGLVVALNNAGYDVGALIAGLGIGGLALAMAAKDTVSNIFGGFTVFTDQPFKINDRIRVSGFDGSVAEIGIRSTKLRTLDGTLVTLPNSTFSDSAVENVSAEPSRKVVSNLGLTYDTSPEQMQRAMAILREITAANPSLEEKVVCGFNAFGDFAMNILLVYYIRSGEDIVGVQSAINLEILTRFNAEGLEFAFPTQTLYTIAQTTAAKESPA